MPIKEFFCSQTGAKGECGKLVIIRKYTLKNGHSVSSAYAEPHLINQMLDKDPDAGMNQCWLFSNNISEWIIPYSDGKHLLFENGKHIYSTKEDGLIIGKVPVFEYDNRYFPVFGNKKLIGFVKKEDTKDIYMTYDELANRMLEKEKYEFFCD